MKDLAAPLFRVRLEILDVKNVCERAAVMVTNAWLLIVLGAPLVVVAGYPKRRTSPCGTPNWTDLDRAARDGDEATIEVEAPGTHPTEAGAMTGPTVDAVPRAAFTCECGA